MSMINTKQGFTLVETLVAIVVLTLSITGPLFIAQQSFNSAITARDRTVAAFLAQEAVEYVRSVRDHNYLSPGDVEWLQGLSACLGSNCRIDASVGTYPSVASCNGNCPVLQQNTNGFYGYQGGEATRFTRTISMIQGPSHEVLVTVEVAWTTKGVTRSVIIRERLFNWL